MWTGNEVDGALERDDRGFCWAERPRIVEGLASRLRVERGAVKQTSPLKKSRDGERNRFMALRRSVVADARLVL